MAEKEISALELAWLMASARDNEDDPIAEKFREILRKEKAPYLR